MAGNLPKWAGADVVYSRGYALLDRMAKSGHVRHGYYLAQHYCATSQTMDDIIDALNKGDEEYLKWCLLESDRLMLRTGRLG